MCESFKRFTSSLGSRTAVSCELPSHLFEFKQNIPFIITSESWLPHRVVTRVSLLHCDRYNSNEFMIILQLNVEYNSLNVIE